MTMKFDGLWNIQEHIIKMTNIAVRLKILDMIVDDSFMVQFILNLLPSKFKTFQINYNIIKDKWDVNELIEKLIQEENRPQNLEGHFVNLVQRPSKGLRLKAKNFKKKKEPIKE